MTGWQPAGDGGGQRRRLTGEQHGGKEEQEAGRHGRHRRLSGLIHLQPEVWDDEDGIEDGMLRERGSNCMQGEGRGAAAGWRSPLAAARKHCRLIGVSFISIKAAEGCNAGRLVPVHLGSGGWRPCLVWTRAWEGSLMSDGDLAGPNLIATRRAAGYVHAPLAGVCRVAGRALQFTYQSSCAPENSWLDTPRAPVRPRAPCSRPAAAPAAPACWPSRPAHSWQGAAKSPN